MQVPHKRKAIILIQGSPRAHVVCVAHLARKHKQFFFLILFFLSLQQTFMLHTAACLQTEPKGLYGEQQSQLEPWIEAIIPLKMRPADVKDETTVIKYTIISLSRRILQ